MKQAPITNKQRRLNERYKEELNQLVNRFFEKSINRTDIEIRANYEIYQGAWKRTVKKVNSDPARPCFLFVDAFDSVIDKVAKAEVRGGKWNEKEEKIRIAEMIFPPSKFERARRYVVNYLRAHFFVLKSRNVSS